MSEVHDVKSYGEEVVQLGDIDEREFVYKSTLSREYGLTPSMIEELGPPDDYCENPYYPRTGVAYLYSVERVEAWIGANVERVEKARASREKRSATANKLREERHAAREKQALEWSKSVEVSVTKPLPKDVIGEAKKHFTFRGLDDPLEEKALRAHVRHNYTNYQALVRESKGFDCSDELYQTIRLRTDEVVTNALREWQAEVYDLEPRVRSDRWDVERD